MKKRLWVLVFCCWIIYVSVLIQSEPTHAETSDPLESAQAAVLVDQTSGRVLYGKNEDQKMKIASLTKIMTAIIAIEKGELEELVTVGPNAVNVEGSSIYLKKDEKVTLETLLYGLMLRSGNDAAVAIAEYIGGSVEGFVYLMNEKANLLGLEHTHFANPHGLDAPEHYSSAKDLAILTQYALQNPTFQRIVKTQVKTVEWEGEDWKRTFINKNKILKLYPPADGVKTGFTKLARRTLVTSATKDGQQLIAVTLNDGNDWQDHMNLFEYGFDKYSLEEVVNVNQRITATEHKNDKGKRLVLVAGKSLLYPLKEDEEAKVTLEPIVSYPLKRVKSNGILVGTARAYFGKELIGTVPLYSKYMEDPSVFSSWKEVFSYLCGRMGPND